MMTAREAALKALGAFRRSGAWSSLFLKNLIEKEGIDKRDAALAANICAGVLQNMYLCDHYISAFCTTKPEKLEPIILDILRLSVYQIAFLDKIPPSAAVNEGVNLTKKYSKKASGLVNAVLRKVSANKDKLPDPDFPDCSKRLSIKYSHPEWIVKELLTVLPEDECEAFLRLDNTAPVLWAQVNTCKTTTDNVMENVSAQGFFAERHPCIPDCISIKNCGNVENLDVFKDGCIYIQDPAARLAVIAAEPEKGSSVIDGCAAPGGKSFASAIAMNNVGKIISCDIHDNKLNLIRSGASRLGLGIIETRCLDGRKRVDELIASADMVIADVPCSGLGVIRKKPEIRYKSEEEILGLPDIQYDILSNLSEYVKPGGTLLYSTCTVLKRENEDVAERFLNTHPDFYAEDFTLPIGKAKNGQTTLWPQKHGTDGFFICKMRKK